jgi:hypothetical protein
MSEPIMSESANSSVARTLPKLHIDDCANTSSPHLVMTNADKYDRHQKMVRIGNDCDCDQ